MNAINEWYECNAINEWYECNDINVLYIEISNWILQSNNRLEIIFQLNYWLLN